MALESPPTQISWRQSADDFHGGHEQEKQLNLQALLDLDDRTLTQQASDYYFILSIAAAPGDQEFCVSLDRGC